MPRKKRRELLLIRETHATELNCRRFSEVGERFLIQKVNRGSMIMRRLSD